MLRVAPAVLLIILAPVALAEEPAREAATGNPLHFRLELGIENPRVSVRPEVRVLAGEEVKVTARPGYS